MKSCRVGTLVLVDSGWLKLVLLKARGKAVIGLRTIYDDVANKLIKFDYTKLIPRVRVDKYSYATGGVEMTWPWRREESGYASGEGLGIGIGVGKYDLWVGWPETIEEFGDRYLIVNIPEGELPAGAV